MPSQPSQSDAPRQVGAPDPERDRVAALHASGLLDTEPDEAFDRLTRLARHLLGVPVSLVSLVDADRQFFKSQQGLAEPWSSARATPLSHSFCQHVVARRAPLVVNDAREHPLVQENLAIRDLHVVAYLGVPIYGPDGYALGSICAIDSEPRTWTDEDLAVLNDLARGAESEVALRHELRARRQVERTLRERESFLRLAVQAADFGAWSADLRSGDAHWDDRAREILGATPDEAVSVERGYDLVHPEDRAHVQEAYDRALTSGDGLYRMEARMLHPSGEVRWVHSWGCVLRDTSGEPTRLFGLVGDVTERREMLELLRDRGRELEAVNKELGTLNATLESRVEKRTAALKARTDQVRALTHALTLAEQRERQRLAHILHDDLQQVLFGIQIQLQLIGTQAGAPGPGSLAYVDELLGRAVTLTRTLSHELAPPALDEEGLEVALGWLAEQFTAVHGLEVVLGGAAPCPVPDRSLRVFLVQLVRELLFNVVKHAGTDHARVQLRAYDPDVEITVSDDGDGFDLSAVEAAGDEGFGMRSVRDRVRLMGGRLTVESAPGQGTRITLCVPTAHALEDTPDPRRGVGGNALG